MSINIVIYCLIFLEMSSILFRFASNPATVSINDPIYEYLKRMETLGFITDLKDGIRPYSRSKIAKLLVECESSY